MPRKNNCTKENNHSYGKQVYKHCHFLVQNFLLRNQVLHRSPKNPKRKSSTLNWIPFHSTRSSLMLKYAALKQFFMFILLHKVTLHKMYKCWVMLYWILSHWACFVRENLFANILLLAKLIWPSNQCEPSHKIQLSSIGRKLGTMWEVELDKLDTTQMTKKRASQSLHSCFGKIRCWVMVLPYPLRQ